MLSIQSMRPWGLSAGASMRGEERPSGISGCRWLLPHSDSFAGCTMMTGKSVGTWWDDNPVSTTLKTKLTAARQHRLAVPVLSTGRWS
jgi:hypothetical protein